ncbi:MAG: C40 family peptidase [Tannerellaceae bacterium]|nr:C40 family peptidase [Tannerellaceae bacterium]
MNRYTHIAALIITVTLLSSCGARRQAVRESSKTSIELSRRFGMRVTEKDNLRLYTLALQWMGTPYRYGGSSRKGIDCSHFVGVIYRDVYRMQLSASAANLLKNKCARVNRSGLREGDLVFFQTGRGSRKTPNHVGVYLKNNKFVHASTSRGVIVSDLAELYYSRTWITGGRVKKGL